MLNSNILTYLSSEVSDAGSNGGRRGTTLVSTGELNKVFPNITIADRNVPGGFRRYRKLSVLAADPNNKPLLNILQFIDMPTPAGDYMVIWRGTATDTQADITGSEEVYGSAFLSADLTGGAGVKTFTVEVESTDLTNNIIKAGRVLLLTSKPTSTSSTGVEETITVDTVSVSGTILTVTSVTDIQNTYLVSENSRVSSKIDIGTIQTGSSNYVATTVGSGTYNEGTYPLQLNNIGTFTDSLTFTLTDATHFACTGASGRNYGTGVTTADFVAVDSVSGLEFFTLPTGGFVDVWAGGDTLTVDIVDASFSYWLKQVVPSGTSILGTDKVTPVTDAESSS